MGNPTADRDMHCGPARTRRIAGAVLTALAVVAATACGADDANSASDDDTADRGVVTITLSDYSFEGVPPTITADTTITVTNASAQEAHELTAFRLPDTEARSLAELQALPPDQLGALVAGAPALAFAARPNSDGELVLGDGTLSEPGRYLLVCFVPTGADPDEVMAAMHSAATDPKAGPPQIAGGPPHLVAGMIAELVVSP